MDSGKQYGFSTGSERLINLLVAREPRCGLQDHKLNTDVAFVNPNKAFDKGLHNRLLSKLSDIGMGNK